MLQEHRGGWLRDHRGVASRATRLYTHRDHVVVPHHENQRRTKVATTPVRIGMAYVKRNRRIGESRITPGATATTSTGCSLGNGYPSPAEPRRTCSSATRETAARRQLGVSEGRVTQQRQRHQVGQVDDLSSSPFTVRDAAAMPLVRNKDDRERVRRDADESRPHHRMVYAGRTFGNSWQLVGRWSASSGNQETRYVCHKTLESGERLDAISATPGNDVRSGWNPWGWCQAAFCCSHVSSSGVSWRFGNPWQGDTAYLPTPMAISVEQCAGVAVEGRCLRRRPQRERPASNRCRDRRRGDGGRPDAREHAAKAGAT